MFEIPEVCEFEVVHDQIVLTTKSNGDVIEIKAVLGKEAAAALSYLINDDKHLAVEIKAVVE